jgi:hypothetical protein
LIAGSVGFALADARCSGRGWDGYVVWVAGSVASCVVYSFFSVFLLPAFVPSLSIKRRFPPFEISQSYDFIPFTVEMIFSLVRRSTSANGIE